MRRADDERIRPHERRQGVISHEGDGQSTFGRDQRLRQRAADGRAAHPGDDDVRDGPIGFRQGKRLAKAPRALYLIWQSVNVVQEVEGVNGLKIVEIVEVHRRYAPSITNKVMG